MSVLAQNIKTIRKELKCTQSSMSDILKVGFRTYVRYEAGERDAPVAVLVKLARLGNISLEQLLTQKISKENVVPIEVETLDISTPEVKTVNFKTGKILFKKPNREEMLAAHESEKIALSLFRKMSDSEQKQFIKEIGKKYKSARVNLKPIVPSSRLKQDRKLVPEDEPIVTKSLTKQKQSKRKGKPGRRKLDRKALREKIESLRKVTQLVKRITVR